MKRNPKMILAAVTMAASFGATGAHAGGLLADLISPSFDVAWLDELIVCVQAPCGSRSNQATTYVTSVPLGQFCDTPMGRFGPGPINPVGTPCNVNTPWVRSSGQVVQ